MLADEPEQVLLAEPCRLPCASGWDRGGSQLSPSRAPHRDRPEPYPVLGHPPCDRRDRRRSMTTCSSRAGPGAVTWAASSRTPRSGHPDRTRLRWACRPVGWERRAVASSDPGG